MKKTIGILFIVGLITFLLTNCGSDESKTTPVEITFPVINYVISPSRDTTLFGRQGTRIFISSGTFQLPDGSAATDTITVQLKEFYRQSDIVLADLSTRCGNQLLETGGMIYLNAFSGGHELVMRPDKKIMVHFPKAKYDNRNMSLFYADSTATPSAVTNWNIDTADLMRRTVRLGNFGWWYPSSDDSTSYEFIPQNFVDTGYYWNPLDFYIGSYPFSQATMKAVENTMNSNTYPDFESWNDYGIECEMKISRNGYITEPKVVTKVSKNTRQEILRFLKKIPQLEPGKNKYGEIIERRGLLFLQAGKPIPIYKTDEAYIQSFDRKYAKYEKEPVRNMDDAELNYYVFRVSKLGWINCDSFMESEERTDLLVHTPVQAGTNLKMAFNDINSVLMANIIDGKYIFPNVPKNRAVTIIGIKNDHGKLLTVFKEITITDQPLNDLIFTETTLADLKTKLEKTGQQNPVPNNNQGG